MNKHLWVGTMLLVCAAVLAIIMMTLEGWWTTCLPGEGPTESRPCWYIGLRTYTYENTRTSTSGSISSLPNDVPGLDRLSSDMYKGGTIILGTGVTGLFCWLVSTVLLVVAHRRGLSSYRVGAMIGMYAASSLLISGVVSYAYQLMAGYSFILMTIAAFAYIVGVGLMLTGGWTVGAAGAAPSDAHKELPGAY